MKNLLPETEPVLPTLTSLFCRAAKYTRTRNEMLELPIFVEIEEKWPGQLQDKKKHERRENFQKLLKNFHFDCIIRNSSFLKNS